MSDPIDTSPKVSGPYTLSEMLLLESLHVVDEPQSYVPRVSRLDATGAQHVRTAPIGQPDVTRTGRKRWRPHGLRAQKWSTRFPVLDAPSLFS